MISSPALIFALIVLPPISGDVSGAWCGQDSGEVMRMNGSANIQFNQTILCTADSDVDLGDDGSWTGTLECDNPASANPIPSVTIRIQILTDTQIVVTPIGRAAETYDFCG